MPGLAGFLAAAACLASGPLPPAAPPVPLRFGLTAQAAGSVGVGQGTVAPEDEAKALSALDGLKLPRRDLVLRLNRMFQSDGDAGIARFAALADTYASHGFKIELQVRYHPPADQVGDVAAYVAFVRKAVRAFAPRPAVVALSITNEANLIASPNTSDGFYPNAIAALVRGIVAAREEADALGRPDLQLGFTYAYRFVDDEAFFDEIGRLATPAFRNALDFVGLQAYPGLFYPPPGLSPPAGAAMVDAADLLRTCLFPRAGIGARTKIWVTENGYRSRRGDDPAVQAGELRDTVDALAAQSGTLGITDYRYFNLRDNDSTGNDLFSAVGLLYDDYAPKPSYDAFRQLIDRHGAQVPAPVSQCRALRVRIRPRLRQGERIRTVRLRVRGGHARRVRVVSHRRAVVVRVTPGAAARRVRVTLRVRTSAGRRLVLHRSRPGCAGITADAR